MDKFCINCGKPLVDGKPCTCTEPTPLMNVDSAKGYIESMKNRMGIGDPELNKGDAYEKGKMIIPDCVEANDGEIPVKQYEIATMQNRILGIPFTKAKGRMQVTNKRVIFRAPGRCWAGRTTMQHEFAIDEIAGLEARREYVLNLFDLIIGIFLFMISGFIIANLIGLLSFEEEVAAIIFALLFGIAGCVPFFMIKKKWLLKLLCLGGSTWSLLNYSAVEGGGFLLFFGVISLIITIFALMLYAIKPNLVLSIKTKSANSAIDIRRSRVSFFGVLQQENTGYCEIIPQKDAERCIREIDAIISDIQKLGDFGVEKWKES